MAKYRWPTDPPGKKPSHSIPWSTHQAHMTQGTTSPGGTVGPTFKPTGPLPYGPGQGPSPPPFDAAAEAARSAANARRTTLLSDADVDLQQTSQEYGFKYNPATGAFGGFDPTNPFSQAALLMESRKNRDRGENTSYAASGQLYSTAYDTAKKETQHQYDRGYDTLRRGFEDYVKNYLRRKRDIQTVPIEELASL